MVDRDMGAHIIVFGNEKGGSGKSTACMHVTTALARMGYRTAVLDLDLRQRTYSRFIQNRARYAQKHKLDLAIPHLIELPELDQAQLNPGENIYDRRLTMAVTAMETKYDFACIDCPGSHTRLSQVAHSLATTLVTPINDSFVDFDLLARVDPETQKILGPSVYSEMVWQARQLRAKAGLKPFDWIVMRNRISTQRGHNKEKIATAVDDLSNRVGFRVIPGLSERVIFRELFPKGLTVFDLRDIGVKTFPVSNKAGLAELDAMIAAMNLPGIDLTGS